MNKYAKQKEIFRRACCNKCVEDKDNIWFSWYTANGICKIDKKTNNAEIVSKFDKYSDDEKLLYYSVEKVDNLLFCIPSAADQICIYDIASGKINYIELEERNRYQQLYGKKFTTSFQYKNSIYMLPINYPAIVKLDANNLSITYIDEWYEYIKEEIPFDDFRGYLGNSIIIDDYVWMTCGSIPMIIKMNLSTHYFEYYHINTVMSGFWGIMFDGKYFWITGRGQNANYVLRWNPITGESYDILVNDLDKKIWDPFHSPIDAGDKLFLFPISASHVYLLDKGTLLSYIYDLFDNCIRKEDYSLGQHQVMNLRTKDNEIQFIAGADYKWYKYDMKTEQLTVQEYMINNAPINIFLKDYSYIFNGIRMESDKDDMESGEATLETFLQIIVEIENEKVISNNE